MNILSEILCFEFKCYWERDIKWWSRRTERSRHTESWVVNVLKKPWTFTQETSGSGLFSFSGCCRWFQLFVLIQTCFYVPEVKCIYVGCWWENKCEDKPKFHQWSPGNMEGRLRPLEMSSVCESPALTTLSGFSFINKERKREERSGGNKRE